MEISTAEILSIHHLRLAQTGDYIDWAVTVLIDGMDSKNLRILAGLDRSVSPFEAEDHFLKAMRELSLSEVTKEEAVQAYATHLAKLILQPNSDYKTYVRKLAELCYMNDYPSCLMEFYYLDDGLYDIESGSYPWGYEELYSSNPRSVVEKVASKFIEENEK